VLIKEEAPTTRERLEARPPGKEVLMAVKSLAGSPQESTSRIERGRALYAEHADQIWFDRRLRCWIVPSENDGTSVYEVTLSPRGEFCECKDWEYRSPTGGCVHIIAATLRKAKTFRCEGCGARFPNRELFQVMEPDHLTFFEGDLLCGQCGLDHGVL
jgi:hypothetical protein